MKKVYFVRHGQSEGNLHKFSQSLTTELTEEGLKQAQVVAGRAKSLKFDLLVASNMTRAQQTAEAIAAATGKGIITSELFREKINPSAVINKPHNSATKQILDEWWEKIGDPDYTTDGETYFDLVERARQAWQWLEDRPEEVGLVVTHGLFVRIMLAQAIFQDGITPEIFRQCLRYCRTSNTGLSVFEIVDDVKPKAWSLISWNDQTHLGDN
jgi:probable phosphoglycerate mutase